MPRQIYNEGRVVGLSAYEIYVKQHQAEDPSVPPASEKEWLASTIAMGSSMLLQVPQNIAHGSNEVWMYEVQLPSDTRLCAANTIVASFFKGNAVYSSNWARRVTDYGDLISNTSESSPSGNLNHDSNIPYQTMGNWTDDEKKQLSQYMRILDGVVIQPGTWSDSSNKPPEKDFSPNLGDYPRIRIQIKGPVEVPFQILFTGFTIRAVVKGVSGLDSSTSTFSPQDGDFLGPATFPWAAKIVFSVPSSYVSYFASGAYERSLPVGEDAVTVRDTAVIDMQTSKPETYYTTNYPNSRVEVNVDDFSTLGDGTAVLTVYQKSQKYPPALWGTFVQADGTNYLNPLDVVAPGTVKMFLDASEEVLKDYENTFEGAFAINKDSENGTIQIIGPDGTLQDVANVVVQDVTYNNIESSDNKAQALITRTGKLRGISLSLSPDTNGTQYTIGDDGTNMQTMGNTSYDEGSQTQLTPSSSNINWAMLLEALANNKSIDVLGMNMKALKTGLNQTYPYIQFKNGLRLYISNTEPTPDESIPIGSIGIGWTAEST